MIGYLSTLQLIALSEHEYDHANNTYQERKKHLNGKKLVFDCRAACVMYSKKNEIVLLLKK